jgi:FUN14 domain-containing protein 1
MSDPVNEFLQRSGPAVSQLSFGGVVGYCSGMAFRRVGKAVGVVIGLGFIGLQTASSFGYLQVDWDKIRDDAIKPLDTVSSLLF